MSMVFRILVVLLLVAACGNRQFSAPQSLEDACALSRERPAYFAAMRASHRRWGVSVPIQMAIIHAESRFIGDARTPRRWAAGVIPMGRQSSAFGYSQALDRTWEEYQQDQNRPRARRDNIRDATDFIGWYSNLSNRRNGIALNDPRNLYLAYHEGHTGFRNRSYLAKPWLLRVADGVARRAAMYETQLRNCGRV